MTARRYEVEVLDVFDLQSVGVVAIAGRHTGDEIVRGDSATLSDPGGSIPVPAVSVPIMEKRAAFDHPSDQVALWLHGVERSLVRAGQILTGPS